MHEILNFSNGLNPNAAYTKFRNSTARDWRNLRVDEQGFLEVRDGHTLVYDDDSVTDIFVHKELMLAIIDSELKWARIGDAGEEIEFNDFDPDINLNATRRWAFTPLSNATGDYIFMGNGTGELTGGLGGVYVIDLADVFGSDDPQDPTAYHPYMNKPSAPTISNLDRGENDKDDDEIVVRRVDIKVQLVQINEDGIVTAISEPSDSVTVSGINALSTGHTEEDLGDDYLDYYSTFDVTLNLSTNAGIADKVDVFITEPYIATETFGEDRESLPYYKIGRLNYQNGLVHNFFSPLTIGGRERLITGEYERVNWQYIESDSVRSYAMRPNDDKLYLSYFDGINIRLFRNFTDFIPLNLNGEEVTGMKFLPETPWLAVYTPNQIILVLTDPNPELMRVIGRYGSTDRDESVGCVAPQSLVAVGRYHYFLGGNKRVYRFAGRGPTWISHQVQPLLNQIEISDTTGIANAYAVAYEGDYYLSYPSRTEEPIHNLEWRGQDLTWREEEVEWKEESYTPNTTLILDTERELWYRDGFGVSFFTKSPTERLYGIIHGNIYSLYDNEEADDSDEVVAWLWRSNRLLMPVQQLVHNINVKIQGAGDVIVKAKTEEGEQTRTITCEDPNHYWGQRAGVNLRGRTLDLTVMGTGPITIDRITINERPRRINRR